MRGKGHVGARSRTLLPLVLALLLVLSSCTLTSPDPAFDTGAPNAVGTTGAATGGTANAREVSSLDARRLTPREELADGGALTLPLDEFPARWNLLHHDGASSDAGLILSATDPVLYDYDPQGTITARPEFLTALPALTRRDGREVVTYDLNPKAVWNDGTPIDYRAFRAVWQVSREGVRRGGYQPVSSAGYEDIESVEAGANPHQVVVTFRAGRSFHPVTDLFVTLLHPAAASVATFNDGFSGGSFHPEWRAGPFTLRSLDTTTKTITLERNPRWWGRTPRLSQISFRELTDSASLPAFTNGEIDATRIDTHARYAQVQQAPDLDVRASRRLQTTVLEFNTYDPILSDIAVRKALWQAIDREQWNRVRYEGMNWSEGAVNSLVYFPFQPQARDNMPVTHDPAAARATLEAAGYTRGSDGVFARDGRRLSVRYTGFGDDPMSNALAETLRTQAAAAGIEVQVTILTSTAFQQVTRSRDFGIIIFSPAANSPSPVSTVCQAMCSTHPFNISGAGSPALDARIRGLGSIADPGEQAEQINAVEKDWLQLYGLMPLANGPDIWAYHRGLANLGPAAFASIHPHWEDVGWTIESGRA